VLHGGRERRAVVRAKSEDGRLHALLNFRESGQVRKKNFVTVFSLGVCLLCIPVLTSFLDRKAPDPVHAFKVHVNEGRVVLTWINPAGNDWAGVLVCRKAGEPPKEPLDGFVLVSGAVDRAEDVEVTGGETYYYAVWTYDVLGNFSLAVRGFASLPSGVRQRMVEGERTVSPLTDTVLMQKSGRLSAISAGTVQCAVLSADSVKSAAGV